MFFARLQPGDYLMIEVDPSHTAKDIYESNSEEIMADVIHCGTTNMWTGTLSTLDYQLRIMFESETR
jgi:hypothetical protein